MVPIWIGRYLPMVDMPQHAAQITRCTRCGAATKRSPRLFEINWFTPYLLGYLLLYAAALVMPITVATQLLVIGRGDRDAAADRPPAACRRSR